MKALPLLFVFIFVSCSGISFKSEEPSREQKVKAQALEKKEYVKEIRNWADSYYSSTVLEVKNPEIQESAQSVLQICQGEDIKVSRGYRGKSLSEVDFKKTPLTFTTKDGFVKKALVTRGICRELALFKGDTKDKDSGFRRSVKSVKMHYIYNHQTYVTGLVFQTRFNDVTFTIN